MYYSLVWCSVVCSAVGRTAGIYRNINICSHNSKEILLVIHVSGFDAVNRQFPAILGLLAASLDKELQ